MQAKFSKARFSPPSFCPQDPDLNFWPRYFLSTKADVEARVYLFSKYNA